MSQSGSKLRAPGSKLQAPSRISRPAAPAQSTSVGVQSNSSVAAPPKSSTPPGLKPPASVRQPAQAAQTFGLTQPKKLQKPSAGSAIAQPGLRQPGSLLKPQPASTATAPVCDASSAPAAAGSFRVGDRVVASGGKRGVIRFIGTPDFAAGNWAGVELDEALGKNDGAVAGKRYFTCAPNHGLFAKVEKLEADSSPGEALAQTPRAASQTAASATVPSSGLSGAPVPSTPGKKKQTNTSQPNLKEQTNDSLTALHTCTLWPRPRSRHTHVKRPETLRSTRISQALGRRNWPRRKTRIRSQLESNALSVRPCLCLPVCRSIYIHAAICLSACLSPNLIPSV